jgi:serine-type D-Ala-D-Ala carboxypeptidase (penicillin-binding protein 5/6)
MHTRSDPDLNYRRAQGSIALSAQAALVLKIPSSGHPQTVYAKNPDEPFHPASLTKLLTVVTALDVASRFGQPLDTLLRMCPGDAAKGTGRNIAAGDRFSLQDAIANMLLPSSNVTANVVARTFGQVLLDPEDRETSPVARFVQEMNTTAAGLGMIRSVFINPHGLKAAAQITTATDMARLLVAANRHPAIANVWGCANYDITIIGPNARRESIASSVKMIEDGNVLGGKTGTLRAVTYNLAICSQTATGTKLASVILCSSSDGARYADMRLLLSVLDETEK